MTTEPHVDTTQAASQQGQPASKSETLQPERPPGCTPPRAENNAPRHRCPPYSLFGSSRKQVAPVAQAGRVE